MPAPLEAGETAVGMLIGCGEVHAPQNDIVGGTHHADREQGRVARPI
jgi:hypothetical protein